MTNTTPPSYTPVGWDDWSIKEYENKTVVLSEGLFCSSKEGGGYFISRTHPQYCNNRAECSNDIDEDDCFTIGFIPGLLITLGIVLVGVVVFLILHFSNMMHMHSTDIVVPNTGEDKDMKDNIIDDITLGKDFHTLLSHI